LVRTGQKFWLELDKKFG